MTMEKLEILTELRSDTLILLGIENNKQCYLELISEFRTGEINIVSVMFVVFVLLIIYICFIENVWEVNIWIVI